MADNRIQLIISALDQTKAEFSSLKSNLEGLANQAKKAGAVIAGAFAAFKIADTVKDIALLAARYETLGVSMRVVGANAGYTAEQMDQYQASLEKTGIAMLEARQSLTRMASAHIDLAKSSDLARIAQDAAVIAGINSSEAFDRMVVGIQSGQVEILRTLGLNVSFENSYKKIAQQLGRTSDSLTEIEKIQARTNAVMEKGRDISGAYEAAMGTAGKQITSLDRYISNLKVTVGSVFNDALLVAVQTFTAALKDVNASAKKLEQDKQLESWGRSIVEIFAVAADGARGIIITIDTLLWSLKSSYSWLAAINSAISLDFKNARGWVDYATKSTDAYIERLENLKSAQVEAGKWFGAKDKSAAGVEEANKKAADEGAKRQAEAEAKAKTDAAKAADKKLSEEAGKRDVKWLEGILKEAAEAQKALEERQKKERDYALWKMELYESFDELADKQAEKDKARREGQIQADLAQVDIAEKERLMSKTDAVQERIRLNEELLQEQKDSLENIDKLNDPAGLLELNEALKEQVGTFEQGYNEGFRRYIDELKTNFQHGVEIARQTAQAMEQAFSDFFFDAFQGKMKSLADYLKSFLTSVQRALAQALGQEVSGSLISGISSLFSGGSHLVASPSQVAAVNSNPFVMHEGGYVPRFHWGGLSSDETPAILQRGEYVVSRRGVAALDAINQGKVSTADSGKQEVHNYYYIQAVDPKSFADLVERNPGAIQKIMQDDARRGGSLWR